MLRKQLRAARAFTLLELVVVLMILAALAGLVISQVAQLGRTTDMAYSAKTSSDIAENLQMHFVLQKRYPTHMDSLLVSTGGPPTGLYDPADDANGNQISGLPDSGPHLDRALEMAAVSDGAIRSFTRAGFDVLVDHERNLTNSNNSGVYPRTLNRSAPADHPFAVVRTGLVTGRGATNSDSNLILSQLFPNTRAAGTDSTFGTDDDTWTLPTGVSDVVAVGLGPSSSCIPETMLNAPIYPGNDGTYYGHFVAYFACFENGERAILVGVSDSYGRLHRYVIEQFNESLPNNQRRG